MREHTVESRETTVYADWDSIPPDLQKWLEDEGFCRRDYTKIRITVETTRVRT